VESDAPPSEAKEDPTQVQTFTASLAPYPGMMSSWTIMIRFGYIFVLALLC